MKNLHIHLVYLAIIGFLTYQYWTKAQALEEAVRSIEMFDKLLKANDLAVSSSLRMELDNYKEIFHSYQSGYINEVSNKIKYSSSTIDKISEWLEKQRTDFIQIAGGFDKNNTDVLAKRLETNPSKQFFTESKIHEFCDSLAHFQKVIESVNDSVTLKELQKRYLILELLHDSSYWMNLKNLTSAETLTQLSVLQNKVQLDKVSFIRYNLYSFTVRDIRFDRNCLG